LAGAAVANGILKDLRGSGGVARAKDHDAAPQLQQGAAGELVIARNNGAIHPLDTPGKFTEKRAAELHQQLRVASGVVQGIIAVEGNKVGRCGFGMSAHDEESQCSQWRFACNEVIGRSRGNLKDEAQRSQRQPQKKAGIAAGLGEV
jgi:hypothetical protein